jgi:hypothetical protein
MTTISKYLYIGIGQFYYMKRMITLSIFYCTSTDEHIVEGGGGEREREIKWVLGV